MAKLDDIQISKKRHELSKIKCSKIGAPEQTLKKPEKESPYRYRGKYLERREVLDLMYFGCFCVILEVYVYILVF